MLWGGELVLRDGVAAGQVTSAAWGETLGACVGPRLRVGPARRRRRPRLGDGSTYEVDVNGSRWPVRVALRPLFDPDGERIKG